MFGKIKKKFQVKSIRNKRFIGKENTAPVSTNPLSKDLKMNMDFIKSVFNNCSDVVIRKFNIGVCGAESFLVMIDGLADKTIINENLLKPLMFSANMTQKGKGVNKQDAYAFAWECALSITNIKETGMLEEVVNAVLSGDTALFIDGSDKSILVSMRKFEFRGVEEPDTEAVVRGSREGFVEPLNVNIALLRRKVKNPKLKFEIIKVGIQTKTDICIAYIKDIANEKIINEVRNRVRSIDVESILESGYIEAYIEDAPLSFFPTVGNSEKPDKVCAKMLEGRVAVITDGTPFVLTVPYLFVEAFQSSEDYYSRPYYATFIRLLRWLSFFISIFLPAFYVAIASLHHELLPTPLLISIAASTEGTPFPAVIEASVMQIIYEILREGGIRLPRPIGQAVSIVGALVIGEAAVSAGLIGAPMVIVVALTAIASFVVPSLSDVSALLRILLIVLAGFAGLYGIMLGIAFTIVHLCSLRSFGMPYTSPIAPVTISDLKDVFIRAPLWGMLTRPRVLGVKNPIRQQPGNLDNPAMRWKKYKGRSK